MKNFNQIVEEAKQHCKEMGLQRFEPNGTSIRPKTSSGPYNREFARYILSECKANHIDPPDDIKSAEEFYGDFTDAHLRANRFRIPDERKQKLINYVKTQSPDSYDFEMLKTFTKKQEFSEEDREFLYNSYVVRKIAENEKRKETVKKDVKIELTESEINEMAESFLTKTVSDIEKELHRPLEQNLENNKREIAAIIGVPGSGKSTFINELKSKGYIHVDVDAIAVNISKKFDVQVSEYENEIYKCAAQVSNKVIENAYKEGYNVAIEKVGNNKEQIYNFTNDAKKIAEDNGFEANAHLKCSHVSKECSTIRASGRTMEQLKNGEDLRFYEEENVFCRDNSSLYAYIDVLQDHIENGAEVFDSFEIMIKEGVHGNDGKLQSISLTNEQLKQKQQEYELSQKIKLQSQRFAMSRMQTGYTNSPTQFGN